MRRVLCLFVLLVPLVLLGGAADAHPLGNFTVNQYSGLRVQERAVLVDFVVDMAEIPAFQTRPSIDTDGDGDLARSEKNAYKKGECVRVRDRIDLSIDRRPVALRIDSSRLSFPPGAAGLATLRLECRLDGRTAKGRDEQVLSYSSRNYDDRLGWREITARGEGVSILSTSVPAHSLSRELTRYPSDLLSSPVDVRHASVRFRAGGTSARVEDRVAAASSIVPRGIDGTTQAFVSLVARRELTFVFGLFAVALALGLGAIHALGPGHGKTVMAAYLVGQRGSIRQGAAIALTVTATHTAGVIALGIALSTSAVFLPERLYPLLGLASGAMLFVLGASLLRRAVRRRTSAAHAHHTHDHEHGHSHDSTTVSRRSLLTMGFAGGLVPSPSALIVLLGAIALNRAWFGVILVLMYGIGMAATLTAAGLLLVRARKSLDRRAGAGRIGRFVTAVPVLSAFVVCAVGFALAIRAAIAI